MENGINCLAGAEVYETVGRKDPAPLAGTDSPEDFAVSAVRVFTHIFMKEKRMSFSFKRIVESMTVSNLPLVALNSCSSSVGVFIR